MHCSVREIFVSLKSWDCGLSNDTKITTNGSILPSSSPSQNDQAKGNNHGNCMTLPLDNRHTRNHFASVRTIFSVSHLTTTARKPLTYKKTVLKYSRNGVNPKIVLLCSLSLMSLERRTPETQHGVVWLSFWCSTCLLWYGLSLGCLICLTCLIWF